MLGEQMYGLWLRVKLRVKMLFKGRQLNHDLDDELRFHLAMREQKLVSKGIASEEARYAALRALGGMDQIKEECRDVSRFNFIENFFQDARYGFRQLRHSPGFTTVTVLTLAVGIGATTVMFSLFDAVFLRPLPVLHPKKLMRVVEHVPKIGTVSYFRYAYYEALHDHARSFEFIFGQTGENFHLAISNPEPAQEIAVRAVTPEFFEALGVRALYGRVLLHDDANLNSGAPPAVLSYGFWRRRFGGNQSVVKSQAIIVNGHPFLVVGVMPDDFHGLSLDTAPDLWIPVRGFPPLVQLGMDRLDFDLAGRLKQGVKLLPAQAECQAIWQPVMRDYYQNVDKLPAQTVSVLLRRGVWLEPLDHGVSVLRSQFGSVFQLLMASAGLLFLIVCANVGGLLLARNAQRQHEISVRLAVGATRIRLVCQMLTESLLLAALGAVGGFLAALAAMPLAVGEIPSIRDFLGWVVPVSISIHINLRVFLFSLSLALFATLLLGLFPALATSQMSLDMALRSSHSSVSFRGRQTLIALQVAFCAILLVAAGLFIRTLRKLNRVDPGFDATHVATITEDWTGQHVAPALLETLLARVGELPGVVSVASSSVGVMRGHGISAGVAPAGQQVSPADWLSANLNYISPGYFDTMQMHITAGRGFVPADTQGETQAGPTKAVVNRAFAQQFFPNADPLGKSFGTGAEDSVASGKYEIIGVVNDAKYRSLREPIRPTFYLLQTDTDSFVLYARTQIPANAIILPLQKALASIDPSLPSGEANTMSDEVDSSIASERVTAVLASLFSSTAALLVCLGIYGLLAHSVTQRQREIGIRMALGARREDVLKMVVGQGFKVMLIGLGIGLVGALALTRFLSSLLFGVKPTDPLTFVVVSLILTAVALVASYIPARRATKVDPMVALRYE
jgi:predicted permease